MDWEIAAEKMMDCAPARLAIDHPILFNVLIKTDDEARICGGRLISRQLIGYIVAQYKLSNEPLQVYPRDHDNSQSCPMQ